ncbi:hypothetical protein C7999DRAFT_12780 [Corynascus novoguineensis]|uniref:Uncharacterized protein n=1 Tax=Corynascus novoguineensis TaxID=1126955 RepID=A0AAN7HL04_9PEZI|nr:hypothetical protein C7999DRAFT_12780 [Corynascus novoguineensis]
MAEVLGVVASGIAVVQAAQSLGKLVVSLSRLWGEVRDVPETIRQILEDLEIAGDLIGVVESEFDEELAAGLQAPVDLSSGGSSVPLTKLQRLTVERCREAHKQLGEIIEDLRADIASSRRRKRLASKAKVVLKKDALNLYERRLHKTLRFLEVALQMYLVSSQKRQPKLIAARVTEALVTGQLKNKELNAPAEAASEDDHNNDYVAISSFPQESKPRKLTVRHRRNYRYATRLLGSLGIEVCEMEERIAGNRMSQSTSYQVRLAPATSLLRRVWDIQISVACSGCKTLFRQYIVVPEWDIRVHETIKMGTWEEFMGLLDERALSPFSTDPLGNTLLHLAMVHRFEFVEPMVRLGFELCLENALGMPTYILLSFFTPSMVNRLTIHRLLLLQNAYEDVATWTSRRVGELMLSHAQIFDWFVANLFPDFYSWPIERRSELLEGYTRRIIIDLEVLGRFFHPDGRLRWDDLGQRIFWEGWQTVFGWLSHLYFLYCFFLGLAEGALGKPMRQTYSHMRRAIRGVILVNEHGDFGAVVTILKRTPTTLASNILFWANHVARKPMCSLPYNAKAYRIQKHKIELWLRHWVEDLQAGGNDIEAYGRAEQLVMLQHLFPQDCPKSLSQGAITFGPSPQDWIVNWEWDPDVGRFVGEFWAWVEDPPLVMPGAWVDDENSDNDEY